jgi:chromosome segregation ATPase
MGPDELKESIESISRATTDTKISIAKIETLLTERAKTIADNTHNIGEAHRRIDSVTTSLHLNSEETHKLAERHKVLEERIETRLDQLTAQIEHLRAQIEHLRESHDSRSRELEKSIHLMAETKSQVKTMWIAFTGAIMAIAAALVKLFTK